VEAKVRPLSDGEKLGFVILTILVGALVVAGSVAMVSLVYPGIELIAAGFGVALVVYYLYLLDRILYYSIIGEEVSDAVETIAVIGGEGDD